MRTPVGLTGLLLALSTYQPFWICAAQQLDAHGTLDTLAVATRQADKTNVSCVSMLSSTQCGQSPVFHGLQVVFMTGNLLKTIIAKMLSSRFHKAAHFDKLQDALHKVCHFSVRDTFCRH